MAPGADCSRDSRRVPVCPEQGLEGLARRVPSPRRTNSVIGPEPSHRRNPAVCRRRHPEGVWDLKNGVKKPMVGVVQVTETIRPVIVTFTLGHGHWATGAVDVVLDGQVVKSDQRRAAGIHANAAMWIDPYLKKTCFIDKVGGSVSFYDTRVRLVRVLERSDDRRYLAHFPVGRWSRGHERWRATG